MIPDQAIPLIRRLAGVFLFIAALAMVAVLWIMRVIPSGALGLISACIPQIIIGFLGMYVFCYATAPSVGLTCIKHPWLGGFVGVAILIIGTLGGSATSLVVYRSLSIVDYVVKPLFWIVLFGAIPAYIIGFIGSITTRLIAKHKYRTGAWT
jgi:hypothetical protein